MHASEEQRLTKSLTSIHGHSRVGQQACVLGGVARELAVLCETSLAALHGALAAVSRVLMETYFAMRSLGVRVFATNLKGQRVAV